MKKNVNWIYKVFLLAFIFSVIFSGISTIMSDALPTWLLPIIIIIVIAIGILFDMIGVAVLTANEANLHAKASKKLKGAKEAVTLLKNSTQVSSICNERRPRRAYASTGRKKKSRASVLYGKGMEWYGIFARRICL